MCAGMLDRALIFNLLPASFTEMVTYVLRTNKQITVEGSVGFILISDSCINTSFNTFMSIAGVIEFDETSVPSLMPVVTSANKTLNQ